jgi:hypothetical protein
MVKQGGCKVPALFELQPKSFMKFDAASKANNSL